MEFNIGNAFMGVLLSGITAMIFLLISPFFITLLDYWIIYCEFIKKILTRRE